MVGWKLAQPVVLHALVVATHVVQHYVSVSIHSDALTVPRSAVCWVDDEYTDGILETGKVEHSMVQPFSRRLLRQQVVIEFA